MLTKCVLSQAQGHSHAQSFCYFDGRKLPSLHHVCPDKATYHLCYFNWPSNYTRPANVDVDTLVDHYKHPGQILICGGNTPDWVTEACYWFDRRFFACGNRTTPFYNVRVTLSEERVNVGSLDLKTQVYDFLPKRHYNGASNGIYYMTHLDSCWQEGEAGDNAVRVAYEGYWGALDNYMIKDKPIMKDEEAVGMWLREAIIGALEGIRNKDKVRYWQYNACQVGSLAPNFQPVACVSELVDCPSAVEFGCGYTTLENLQTGQDSPRPRCPSDCDRVGPCLKGVPGYKLPQSITAEIYDRDETKSDRLTVTFESKQNQDGCSRVEKIFMVMPYFIPISTIGIFIGNIIQLDCMVRGTKKQHRGTHL
ncbi:hypothetical protein BCR37DRAFT_264355 [Protomyces lactucae-debilis]|uniref:Uncharacterized protein n=1 Tax=Protomyces lactucae-debilis TaxID=2754530 RepID=A0A1Y2FM89_PROLT|nr:uncharacterized protein BCR37DRAFT_264355 [Protomyces lactucae-debilis]ORY84336.1 hypothetical protein BCR37DRAFT_264355 [Protomyces lactucae-debilis]